MPRRVPPLVVRRRDRRRARGHAHHRARRRACRAVLALAALLLAAAPARAQERVDRRLAADRDLSLRIYNLAGSVIECRRAPFVSTSPSR